MTGLWGCWRDKEINQRVYKIVSIFNALVFLIIKIKISFHVSIGSWCNDFVTPQTKANVFKIPQ